YVIVGQGVLLELAGHAQQLLGLLVEARAAGRQRYALGMVADEQLQTEAVFQALDRRGDRRLGDVQLARGFGHAAALNGGDEVLELAQGVGGHGGSWCDCCCRGALPSPPPLGVGFLRRSRSCIRAVVSRERERGGLGQPTILQHGPRRALRLGSFFMGCEHIFTNFRDFSPGTPSASTTNRAVMRPARGTRRCCNSPTGSSGLPPSDSSAAP